MRERVTGAAVRRGALVLALCWLIAGCGIAAVPRSGSGAAVAVRPQASASSDAQRVPTVDGQPAQGRFFAVDKVVRSTQLAGIDLHLRFVEQTADGLVLHLSFYNNRGEDLAYVTGADVTTAQLVAGATTFPATAHSTSFDAGISPEGSWLSGGSAVGTLTFAAATGSAFTLVLPGFPDLGFALDAPLAAAPDAAPPANGTYRYAIEVTSPRLENIVLRVEQAVVEDDALLLTIAFRNANASDISFSATLTGHDAVVFDGLWQQYRPGQVAQTLDRGIQPAGDVWGENEANSGVLTFPRPTSGAAILLHVPSYPLVRLPLTAGATAEIATDADLPPSVAPRPTPTPAPTPTPLTGDDLARQQTHEVVAALAAALSARDRATYVGLFAPELQAEQGELFDRMATLPLTDVKLEPGDVDAALPNGASEMRGVGAELSYAVQDATPRFSAPLEFTLRRDGADERWLIREVGGQLPFWAYGPTDATRSGPFWIFYRPELAEEVPKIEGEAQAAFERVNQALPGRAATVNVMNITATEEEFAALTQRSGSRFLGVASARYQINKRGIDITSQSFFINGAAFESDPAQDRQRTIAHELTHLVLSPRTMPYTPAWVSEGAAMYITDDFSRAALSDWYAGGGADEIALRELTAMTSFGGEDHSGDQTSINYAYSAYLAKYLVATYGKDTFLRFYDSFAEVPFDTIRAKLPQTDVGSVFDATMGEIAQQVTPEKVQAAFGVDIDTLEHDYEGWLGAELAP